MATDNLYNDISIFDAEYYLANNPLLAAALEEAGVSAQEHYYLHGAAESAEGGVDGEFRLPNAWFDIDFYRTTKPGLEDVPANELLAHFALHGSKELLAPNPAYADENGKLKVAELAAYLEANPEVKAAVAEMTGSEVGAELTPEQASIAAFHFFTYGIEEGLSGGIADIKPVNPIVPDETDSLTEALTTLADAQEAKAEWLKDLPKIDDDLKPETDAVAADEESIDAYYTNTTEALAKADTGTGLVGFGGKSAALQDAAIADTRGELQKALATAEKATAANMTSLLETVESKVKVVSTRNDEQKATAQALTGKAAELGALDETVVLPGATIEGSPEVPAVAEVQSIDLTTLALNQANTTFTLKFGDVTLETAELDGSGTELNAAALVTALTDAEAYDALPFTIAAGSDSLELTWKEADAGNVEVKASLGDGVTTVAATVTTQGEDLIPAVEAEQSTQLVVDGVAIAELDDNGNLVLLATPTDATEATAFNKAKALAADYIAAFNANNTAVLAHAAAVKSLEKSVEDVALAVTGGVKVDTLGDDVVVVAEDGTASVNYENLENVMVVRVKGEDAEPVTAAEKAEITTLEGAISAVEAFELLVSHFEEARSLNTELKSLNDAIVAAEAAITNSPDDEDAPGLGITLLEGDATDFTTGDDVYLFSAESAGKSLNDFGADGLDNIFFGQGFSLVKITGENGIKGDQGDVNALEIFWEQDGNNVNLYIEDKAFAGNGSTEADLTKLTLVGVNGSDIQDNLDNGFLTAGEVIA